MHSFKHTYIRIAYILRTYTHIFIHLYNIKHIYIRRPMYKYIGINTYIQAYELLFANLLFLEKSPLESFLLTNLCYLENVINVGKYSEIPQGSLIF